MLIICCSIKSSSRALEFLLETEDYPAIGLEIGNVLPFSLMIIFLRSAEFVWESSLAMIQIEVLPLVNSATKGS